MELEAIFGIITGGGTKVSNIYEGAWVPNRPKAQKYHGYYCTNKKGVIN